jgi:hypothetical protein
MDESVTPSPPSPQPIRQPTPKLQPPPAAGVRIEWSAVPASLRAAVEDSLGGTVVAAVTQIGGFSPGAAARLVLSDGTRAFAKAVGPELNPDSPRIYRDEIRIAAALPHHAPAPRLLASFDRDEDGWVALVFEDIAGRMPSQPWTHADLDRVLAAISDLAAVSDPSPVAAPSAVDALSGAFSLWSQTLASSADLGWTDPWTRDNLADLAVGWPEAVKGTALVHGDLRADNILLTDDRVFFVDWPWACVGASWIDLVLMLPSIAMQGGPDPESIVDAHPLLQGVDPHAVTSVVAALTGYFLAAGNKRPVIGLPTVRAFQRAQGATALSWLRSRVGQASSTTSASRTSHTRVNPTWAAK